MDESVHVLSDLPDWKPIDGVEHFCAYEPDSVWPGREARELVNKWLTAGRVIFDVFNSIVTGRTITVDLIDGDAVVRESGDAVHAITVNINVPGLSTPINRDGQALIDGGLIKNIPADVLVPRCNCIRVNRVSTNR